MKIFIFLGPTLPVEEARRELDAIYLPPVSQGDVLQAVAAGPWAIGIIDGYFEHVPAVWHKEILWALSRNIRVVGSSSMGALRAAELENFGMKGVGKIFEAFHRGELEDDDEVAVAHGPAESGYLAGSEAMVNMRHTLAAAEAAGVIVSSTHEALVAVAKGLFYPERDLSRMLAEGLSKGLPGSEIQALKDWWPAGRIDQKREDALALLRLLRAQAEADEETPPARFVFQHTEAWEELCRDGRQRSGLGGLAPAQGWPVELRLQGEEAWARARDQARLRALGLEAAHRDREEVDPAHLGQAIEAFRRDRGLLHTEELDRWLTTQAISRQGFLRLMEEETLLTTIDAITAPSLEAHLANQVRTEGNFGTLLTRARKKQQTLAERGLVNPRPEDLGLSENEVWHWYFEERLGRQVPEDLEEYARRVDFEDLAALRRAVLREAAFCTGTSTALDQVVRQ
jgi:hypothetical protein